MSYYTGVAAASAFFSPEIISIEDDKMQQFYKDEPRLEGYRRMLDKIRAKKAHTLSEAEEKLSAAEAENERLRERVAELKEQVAFLKEELQAWRSWRRGDPRE